MTFTCDVNIKLLIIDDELLARRHLEQCLEGLKDITICDFCANGEEALISIKKYQPDILLLDIEMPDMTGFELLIQLTTEQLPYVIFVTAYNQYAVNAFEINALDYILKPITKTRLIQALQRYKDKLPTLNSLQYQHQLQKTIATINPKIEQPKITVNDGEQYHVLTIKDIKYVKSAGNYACVYYGDEVIIVRQTLKKLLLEINSENFRQIHRSLLVNISHINAIKPHINGEYILKLSAGERLKVSRTYKESIQDLLS